MSEQGTATLPLSRPEVETQLLDVITQSLDLDPGEITKDSKLMEDLDADSLDVLDINFRVNELWGVNLPIAELRKRFEESEVAWIDEHGRITAVGIEQVRDLIPEVEGRVEPGDVLEEIFAVLTVNDLITMLCRRLDVDPDC